MDFSEVRKLKDRVICSGERWIFSAGFNVKPDLKSTERIDEEIDDITQISQAGGIISILSHQGSTPKEIRDLDFVADYLSAKLKKPVRYFPTNDASALEFSKTLNPGEIVLFGNTRFNPGETKNCKILAEHFSSFGNYVAIGGFSKAHRANSSNVGILKYIPGFLAQSQINEMQSLSHWSGRSDSELSVVVLGGVKKEKITDGVFGFLENYDYIIPGGIVLNTFLSAKGIPIGDSVITDSGERYDKQLEPLLYSFREKILLPKQVTIAKKIKGRYQDIQFLNLDEGKILDDYQIVDFALPELALSVLEKLALKGGRLVLAGTPGVYSQGFVTATNALVPYLNNSRIKSIALGGDTVGEILNLICQKSSGGGSALAYISKGTTEVYEALKKNKIEFP